jgi:hypothetical protein
MGVIRKILGPKSKYDESIPYTYFAKVSIVEGDNDLVHCYFSDTICGLIEYLDENNIRPEEVELFGCYLKKEIPIDKKYCLTEDGKWLKRPYICNSLETHYKQTMEEQYKGHIALGDCSFDDRERNVVGAE